MDYKHEKKQDKPSIEAFFDNELDQVIGAAGSAGRNVSRHSKHFLALFKRISYCNQRTTVKSSFNHNNTK